MVLCSSDFLLSGALQETDPFNREWIYTVQSGVLWHNRAEMSHKAVNSLSIELHLSQSIKCRNFSNIMSDHIDENVNWK